MCSLWKKLILLAKVEVGAICAFLLIYAVGTILGRFDKGVSSSLLDAFFFFVNVATIAIVLIAGISLILCGWNKCVNCGKENDTENH